MTFSDKTSSIIYQNMINLNNDTSNKEFYSCSRPGHFQFLPMPATVNCDEQWKCPGLGHTSFSQITLSEIKYF